VDEKAEKRGFNRSFLYGLYLGISFFLLYWADCRFDFWSAPRAVNWSSPVLGMFAFSLAFAIPFTLFAIFPEWMNRLPKSGGWLNSVKVVLGFLELALAFKFLFHCRPGNIIGGIFGSGYFPCSLDCDFRSFGTLPFRKNQITAWFSDGPHRSSETIISSSYIYVCDVYDSWTLGRTAQIPQRIFTSTHYATIQNRGKDIRMLNQKSAGKNMGICLKFLSASKVTLTIRKH